MKTLLIISILIISIAGHSQPAPDSVSSKAIKMPPDSVAIISIRDIGNFYQWLRDNVSVSNYEKMKPENLLNELIIWASGEYWKKKKK